MSEICGLCHGNQFITNPDWTTESCPVCVTTPKNIRSQILSRASDIINGNREDTYGTPQQNFACVAKIWSAILGIEISPAQVCLCMVGVKLGRAATGKIDHEDNYTDMAGFAGLGAEVSKNDNP